MNREQRRAAARQNGGGHSGVVDLGAHARAAEAARAVEAAQAHVDELHRQQMAYLEDVCACAYALTDADQRHRLHLVEMQHDDGTVSNLAPACALDTLPTEPPDDDEPRFT